MTRKEYQEECFRSFIQEEYPSSVWDNIEFMNSLRDAFNTGVDCADILPKPDVIDLAKVWHDTKEEPEKKRLIVGIDEDGVSIYKWADQDNDWLSFAEWYSLTRWAYIDDLLPKEGNEKDMK